ncbi:MAG: ThuA domain-containing protein, partial [Polyangia bacterium]
MSNLRSSYYNDCVACLGFIALALTSLAVPSCSSGGSSTPGTGGTTGAAGGSRGGTTGTAGTTGGWNIEGTGTHGGAGGTAAGGTAGTGGAGTTGAAGSGGSTGAAGTAAGGGTSGAAGTGGIAGSAGGGASGSTAGGGGQAVSTGGAGGQTSTRPMRVLLYTLGSAGTITGIPAQIAAYKQKLMEWGYQADESADAAMFTDTNLAKYAAVGMINTCFYPFGQNKDGSNESKAMQKFLRQGGGVFGTHCADVTFTS